MKKSYQDAWGEEQAIANRRASPDTRCIPFSALIPFSHALITLSPTEQKVFIRYHLGNESSTKIAIELGVTKGCISKLIQRIKSKMSILDPSILKHSPSPTSGSSSKHSLSVCRTTKPSISEDIDENEDNGVVQGSTMWESMTSGVQNQENNNETA